MGISRALIACCLGLSPLLMGGYTGRSVAGDSPEEAKGKGYVIVSLTRSGLRGPYVIEIELRGRGSSHMSTQRVAGGLLASSDWPCPTFAPVPENQPCGRLAVLELPEGEYEFHSWHGTLTRAAPLQPSRIQAREKFSKWFRVTAGQAVYLGNVNIHVIEECADGPLHLAGSRVSYSVDVNDMQERDLALLYRKDPRFAPGTVQKRLALAEKAVPLEEIAALRRKADEGNADAQIALGLMYIEGHSFPRDYDKASQLFRQAAERGSAQGQYHLGIMHRDGEGFSPNGAEAETWFRKAAEQGHVDAQASLASLYLEGRGVPRDEEKALGWFLKVAGKGYPPAQHNVGAMYFAGQGTPKNYAEAIRWFREAAAQGYAPSQNSLGHAYRYGQGVPRDLEEAVRWFRIAANQRHPLAYYNLGGMYLDGEGVSKDLRQAATWYRLAAEQGDATSQYNLGLMYAGGVGVSKDESDAYLWLFAASQNKGSEDIRAKAFANLEALAPKFSFNQRMSIQSRAWRMQRKDQAHLCSGKALPLAEFR